MAANICLPSLQSHLLKSHFLGRTHFLGKTHFSNRSYKPQYTQYQKPCTKFNLFEAMGGRGLCNGEEGFNKSLQRKLKSKHHQLLLKKKKKNQVVLLYLPFECVPVPEDGFEKELMGLTGGFPGGEKGLKLFIQKNPPPEKPSVAGSYSENLTQFSDSATQVPKDRQTTKQ